MKKRLQIVMSSEAWPIVEALTLEANTNFDTGRVSFSDVINEMILNAKIDTKVLQRKHTDWRKTLRIVAGKADGDIESAIKILNDLKASTAKNRKPQQQEGVSQ